MEEKLYKQIDLYSDSLEQLSELPVFNPTEWRKVRAHNCQLHPLQWMHHYKFNDAHKDVNAVCALRTLIVLSTQKAIENQEVSGKSF